MEEQTSPLYRRLLQVCRDQGIESPRNLDISRITGLSSGRVTQIKTGSDDIRISADALMALNKLGYLTPWILDGKGPRKSDEPRDVFEQAAIVTDSDTEARLLLMYRGIDIDHRHYVEESVAMLFSLFSELPPSTKEAILARGRSDEKVERFGRAPRFGKRLKERES